jgi:hypothetical protein
MGEDVDVYKNGKVASHEGAWLSGVKGAKFGLMMPGTPRAGHKFYQEKAPGVGMDRAEIISVDEKVTTPREPSSIASTQSKPAPSKRAFTTTSGMRPASVRSKTPKCSS